MRAKSGACWSSGIHPCDSAFINPNQNEATHKFSLIVNHMTICWHRVKLLNRDISDDEPIYANRPDADLAS
jgi:hypothetical protein